jgi:hypothetical protein
MAVDYTLFQRRYASLTTDFEISALAVNPTAVLVPRDVNYQIFIQRAELVVSIYAVGTVKLVGATSGRIYATFNIPAAASASNVDLFALDYGPTGFGVNIGEAVNVVWSNAAMDILLHIEAYDRLAVTIGAWDASPSTQASSKTAVASNLLN